MIHQLWAHFFNNFQYFDIPFTFSFDKFKKLRHASSFKVRLYNPNGLRFLEVTPERIAPRHIAFIHETANVRNSLYKCFINRNCCSHIKIYHLDPLNQTYHILKYHNNTIFYAMLVSIGTKQHTIGKFSPRNSSSIDFGILFSV